MLREITIGQYYPVSSPIHRLDPRTKLLGTLLYIISIFVADNLWGYILAGVMIASLIAAARIPIGYMLKGMKPILIILLFTVIFNLFLTPGETLVQIWKLTITKQGVRTAIFMAVRLVYLIFGASLLTFTTTPTALTDGLEKGLGFLNVLHVPVHEIAMMMSIALRFIPILTEETDKIMKAQMARGADFESGRLLKRAKSLVPLLVPLFISAFRRASDLAQAMEARCYHGGKGRTKMHPLHYQKRDAVAYVLVAVYFAAMIVLAIVL